MPPAAFASRFGNSGFRLSEELLTPDTRCLVNNNQVSGFRYRASGECFALFRHLQLAMIRTMRARVSYQSPDSANSAAAGLGSRLPRVRLSQLPNLSR